MNLGGTETYATRSRRSASALTLLEIMVAIALLAMIVVSIYAAWNSILKGSRVALDAAAASQRTRITMRTLQDSLLCACMFNGNATNYSFDVSSSTDFSSLSFVARLPKSFPRSGKFGDLAVRRIEFSVESGGGNDSKNQLVLRQRPLIADFTKDEAEHPLVLARDVVKFLVEFIDPKTGDWIPEWTYTNQLPKAARITVGMGHLDQFSDKAQDVRVEVVALPAVSVPPQLQNANALPPGPGQGQTNGGNGGPLNNNGQQLPGGTGGFGNNNIRPQ